MCGITAYIGKQRASQVLFEGLQILQNRGYDSAGISTIRYENEEYNNEIITTKSASINNTSDSLEYLRDLLPRHQNNNIGIALLYSQRHKEIL